MSALRRSRTHNTATATPGAPRWGAGVAPPRARRRWLVWLLIAPLWLLALAVLCELAARWAFAKRSAAHAEHQAQFAERMDLDNARETLWEVTNFRYRPHFTVDMRLGQKRFQATSNSRGFRTREPLVPKPAGHYRIVCFGGSTTVEGLTNEETYPAELERLLQARFGPRVEVFNCGISGLNSYGELQKFPEYLAFEPDLLVEYNAVNDLIWLFWPTWQAESAPWLRLAGKSFLLRERLPRWLLPTDQEIDLFWQHVTVANVGKMAAQARGAHVELACCTLAHPALDQLSAHDREYFDLDLKELWNAGALSLSTYCRWVDRYNELLERFGRREGVTIIPTATGMVGGCDLFSDMCHGTPRGIRRKAALVAEALAPRVERALAAR